MPFLIIGSVALRATSFRRLADERGGNDWRKRSWAADLHFESDAEAIAFRAAVEDDVPRAYVRAVNGELRGGPLTACSGDGLGEAVSCGVEMADEEWNRRTATTWTRALPITLREA